MPVRFQIFIVFVFCLLLPINGQGFLNLIRGGGFGPRFGGFGGPGGFGHGPGFSAGPQGPPGGWEPGAGFGGHRWGSVPQPQSWPAPFSQQQSWPAPSPAPRISWPAPQQPSPQPAPQSWNWNGRSNWNSRGNWNNNNNNNWHQNQQSNWNNINNNVAPRIDNENRRTWERDRFVDRRQLPGSRPGQVFNREGHTRQQVIDRPVESRRTIDRSVNNRPTIDHNRGKLERIRPPQTAVRVSGRQQQSRENRRELSRMNRFNGRNGGPASRTRSGRPPSTGSRLSPPQSRNFGAKVQRLFKEIGFHSDYFKRPQQSFEVVQDKMSQFYNLAATQFGRTIDYNPLRVTPLLPKLTEIEDSTELRLNRNILSVLFESDIVLTGDQVDNMIRNLKGGRRREKRKVISDTAYRWRSLVIPFRLSHTDANWQQAVRYGLQHWEEETCLRFQENGAGNDYLNFIHGEGCYSSVGRLGGGQTVSIGDGCEILGIVAHEIGHSIGFWHEQARPDRDSYITIEKEAIIPMTIGNFDKRDTSEVNAYGISYDIGSVMHYGPTAFAARLGQTTITTKDSKYVTTIGQRAELSFIDVKQANAVYCSHICRQSLGCKNGGYEDPNNCEQCKCPDGLGGRLCDRVQPSSCGGELKAKNYWQTLSSSHAGKCYWRIRAKGAKVRFEVKKTNYICRATCSAYLEIKYKIDVAKTGFRLCCSGTETGGELVSWNDFILVKHTHYGVGSFSLRYKIERHQAPSRITTRARQSSDVQESSSLRSEQQTGHFKKGSTVADVPVIKH